MNLEEVKVLKVGLEKHSNDMVNSDASSKRQQEETSTKLQACTSPTSLRKKMSIAKIIQKMTKIIEELTAKNTSLCAKFENSKECL